MTSMGKSMGSATKLPDGEEKVRYIGYYNHTYRRVLVAKWREILNCNTLPYNGNMELAAYLLSASDRIAWKNSCPRGRAVRGEHNHPESVQPVPARGGPVGPGDALLDKAVQGAQDRPSSRTSSRRCGSATR